MGKSLSKNNLQKIHTYAQDIEAVKSARGVKSSTPAIANQNTPTPKIITPTPTPKSAPKKTEPATALLVPDKPKLPAIRTMSDDSKKVSSDKSSTTSPVIHPPKERTDEPTTLPTTKTPQKKEDPVYTKTPTTLPSPTKLSEAKNLEPKTEKRDHIQKTPALDTTKTSAPKIAPDNTKIPQTKKPALSISTPIQSPTRDKTYSATVITDTKHKRFSIWNELFKKVSAFINTKTAKKKVNYTTTTTPLRKGVVQSATTNTARKTIADYSSLKDRVKTRKPTQIEDEVNKTIFTETPDQGEVLNNAALEKTRSELLNSIEKEVSEIDDELPEYISPVRHSSGYEVPVFVQHTTNTTPAPASSKNKIGWEHYTDENQDDEIETKPNLTEAESTPVSLPTEIPTVSLPIPEVSNRYPSDIVIKRFPIKNRQVENQTAPQIHSATLNSNPKETLDDTLNTKPKVIFDEPEETTPTVQTEFKDHEQHLAHNKEVKSTPHIFNTPYVNGVEVILPPKEGASEFVGVSINQTALPTTEATESTLVPQFVQPKIEPLIPTELPTANQASTESTTNFYEDKREFMTPPEQSTIPPIAPIPPIDPTVASQENKPELTQSIPATNRIPLNGWRNRAVRFITEYTQTFIFGGLVAATILVVGSIAMNSLWSQFNSTSNTTSSHRYINSSSINVVTVSPLSQLTITEQIFRHNNAIGVSELILQNNESVKISPTIITQLLRLPLEPSFNASLTDIRFGWYREAPFIVLRYSGDSTARGALLQWERTMHNDILPLFNRTITPTAQLTPFRDSTINNLDVRILYTSTGEEVLLYGIVAPGHILITTSEMSFLNLTTNFNANQ
jgi:hypothetical protein